MAWTYHCGSYRDGSNLIVEDTIRDWCADFVDDYDIAHFADLYRDQINKNLVGTTIVLRGNEFFCAHKREDAYDQIVAAIVLISDEEMTAWAQQSEREAIDDKDS